MKFYKSFTEINEGDKFMCKENFSLMFKKGTIYISPKDEMITNDLGLDVYIMIPTANKYFNKIVPEKEKTTPVRENNDTLKKTTITKDNNIKDNNIKDNKAKEKFDDVQHPNHYYQGIIGCIDAMESAYGTQAVLDFCICNAFKYIWRFQLKNNIEDIKKCKWYLNKVEELKIKLDNVNKGKL